MTKLLAGIRNCGIDSPMPRSKGAYRAWGSPLANARCKLSGDGYLLVGDAGHLIVRSQVKGSTTR